MKRKIAMITVWAFALVLTASCSGFNQLIKEPGKPEAYLVAEKALNGYWKNYLDIRDAMPAGPAKDAFRAKFNDTGKDSYFTKARLALDAWDEALGTENAVNKQELFDAMLKQIIGLMLSEGIIKVE